VFIFVHLLPGDPARLIAGPDATLQDIEAVRQDLGLDRPLWWQYRHYLASSRNCSWGGRSRRTSRCRS
jgi:glutathione transport system permease protein